MTRVLSIFLFIAISMVATWFITERMKAPEDSMVGLYESHAKACMNYWTTDTSFRDTVSLQAQAMKLYDQGEYPLALEAFQRFEPEAKDEALYNLYMGICYLKCDFANMAIVHFTEASDLFKKFEMIQLSKWYLAMAHLKAGQEKEAVENLQSIIAVNGPQRYKSEEILKEINVASNPIQGFILAFKD